MEHERRWLVIASDGRHATLGRATDPTPEQLEAAATTLRMSPMLTPYKEHAIDCLSKVIYRWVGSKRGSRGDPIQSPGFCY